MLIPYDDFLVLAPVATILSYGFTWFYPTIYLLSVDYLIKFYNKTFIYALLLPYVVYKV
jgi:hypothetical protein